jgi:hypothetical protein
MTRATRKLPAKAHPSDPVASAALATQPAIPSVATSLITRKTTSSVSNRFA